MKFRKKPIIIEAVQWFQLGDHAKVMECWFSENNMILHFGTGPDVYKEICTRKSAAIRTMEGWHEVTPGDWIVTGVKGEFYPVKQDIFAQTYELAEPLTGERAIFSEFEAI